MRHAVYHALLHQLQHRRFRFRSAEVSCTQCRYRVADGAYNTSMTTAIPHHRTHARHHSVFIAGTDIQQMKSLTVTNRFERPIYKHWIGWSPLDDENIKTSICDVSPPLQGWSSMISNSCHSGEFGGARLLCTVLLTIFVWNRTILKDAVWKKYLPRLIT